MAIAALEHIGHGPVVKRRDDVPLYPSLDCRRSGFLKVDRAHRLYWEESGNPDGVPVVFLHGGPGAGTAPAYRRFFDPEHYRIVLFDQRGAGKSTPEAGIDNNTTWDLVDDIERLRLHLGIERWVVFGGSWGSTLALAYGQAHPDVCIGFILRGIFLFSDQEVDWFVNGMGQFFPEAARAFAAAVPAKERDDLLAAYHARLTDPDPLVHKPAAVAWCAYENACSRLIPATGRAARQDSFYAGALAMARIESHYMVNRGFLEPDQLIDGIQSLSKHPAVIVQGRYDMVCPIATADRLARAWDGAAYRVIPDAGHSSMEPGVRSALIRATDEFRIYR